jgi:hypothetical protein
VKNSSKSIAGVKIDIGINRIVATDFDSIKEEIKAKYGLVSPVDYKDMVKNKYLLVVDGHTWPARLQPFLNSNSVILYNGIFIDWFNWLLKPYVHYVPFAVDYSDLEDQIRWLAENDKAAKQISENAKALMTKISRIEQNRCYVGLLMIEYQRLIEKGQKKAMDVHGR